MTYRLVENLYTKSIELIDKKHYLEAIKLLIQISSSLNYLKKTPFEKEQFSQTVTKCYIGLKHQNLLKDEILIAYGIILRNEGYLQKSIEIFDKVLDFKIHKEAILEKAYSLELLGQYEEAMTLLTKALNHFPHEKKIINNLATLYEELEEWDLALNYYNLSIEIDNEAGISYYNKGRILFTLEQYDIAADQFKTALKYYKESDYRTIDVYLFLSDCHFQLKQYQKAKNIIVNTIKSYPQRGEGYYSLAEYFYKTDQYHKAIKYINKAIDLSLPNAEYYYKKSQYLNHLNHSSNAIKTLNEGLKHFPDNIDILDQLSETLFIQGKYQNAIQTYKKRLKINHQIEHFLQIAQCYFHLKKYSEAFYWINLYIKEESFDVEAYILRAKINAITGYHHLAMHDLKSAQDLEKGELYLEDSDWIYLEKLNKLEEYHQFIQQFQK